jgi:hypothetical protein
VRDAYLDREGRYADYKVDWYEERTINDIYNKLVKYGSISEKQEAFLRTLLKRIDTRDEREAKRAAERAAAADCPEGRVEISGEVVSVKWHENGWGGAAKMTVKSDEGYLVWMSKPYIDGADAEQIERGSRVTVRATVKRSDDDPKFGFGKRPHLIDHTPAPSDDKS